MWCPPAFAMIKYEIEDEFETTVDRFWDVFFDDAFNDALWKHLDIERDVFEFERSGEGPGERIRRKQRLTPKRDVPAALKRLVKNAISYEEHNEWERGKSLMTVITIPSFMSDKFDGKGDYKVLEMGPNRVKRVWTASLNCSVPLVGGRVESHIVGEVTQSYKDTTTFMRKWLAENG